MVRYRNFDRHPLSAREGTLSAMKMLLMWTLQFPKTCPTALLPLLAIKKYRTARYLVSRTRLSFLKSSVHRDQVLANSSPRIFKKAFRMTKEQMDVVVDLIKDHPCFQSTGYRVQPSVRIQLMVALQRLAHNGSLASYESIDPSMGVSVGTAHKYYQRVITALCAIANDIIKWPDANRKAEIKLAFAKAGFPDLIGIIDGTDLPHLRAPSWKRDFWATRKGRFAMGATAICDHEGIFTAFYTGVLRQEDVDVATAHVLACVVLHNVLTRLDKDDQELMDPESNATLEQGQEQQKWVREVQDGVTEGFQAQECLEEDIDFSDWKAVERYEAAMKVLGDIKRAKLKATMFNETSL
ncbi:hypothetical protein BCR41DRAFT_418035 [Lobosporangium transversale]|uniref:DDE Tnp4 domain-containing protein n=1 Tax=Lobosporangium transversale TaxID=64571 RepID=A0A1Y2H4K0_9FUNG|nr:hypothetical protein BCR41DRAFT_418035 [Lobosporangium transversale]ORZ28944.1 hypothetical protein BCR41DRAFT_418035 [Lobosporangium transversale]|eukprot:XP_021886617.1 hypothetical protein BCR41DRAFT_418035 [Lobosporangium transversale]